MFCRTGLGDRRGGAVQNIPWTDFRLTAGCQGQGGVTRSHLPTEFTKFSSAAAPERWLWRHRGKLKVPTSCGKGPWLRAWCPAGRKGSYRWRSPAHGGADMGSRASTASPKIPNPLGERTSNVVREAENQSGRKDANQ